VDALVLTYHAVDDGNGPLHVDPATFAAHLDCIAESGAAVVTVAELARSLREGDTSALRVAITFDDGLASVARIAAPMLAARGLRATVFCVAGHIGGVSDWPTALPGWPALELVDAEELAGLARSGWEIGGHGMTHMPLRTEDATVLDRELRAAKALLEDVAGAPVTTFAYPYGTEPTAAAAKLVAATYDAACTTAVGLVGPGSDPYALSRVDAHYVRRPRLLRAALSGTLGPYLRARRLGASARRTLRRDYAEAAR
jgi:peptidoglycan/xylan/chitin deacetylase (PgdA/CDA1 family)